MTSHWERFRAWLERSVNGASLAVFRIAVGLVMALEALSLLRPSASTSGAVMLETYYTGPGVTFHLPYAWFEWLPLLPAQWLYGVVAVLGIAALSMAAGFFYRISALLVFLAWGYLYAVESTRTYWMSYYYLELLITFLLIWMPAANRYSLDALMRKEKSPTVPFWTIALLRAQLVVTYFYAGVAKLNPDWLLDAVPLKDFLARSQFLKRMAPDAAQSEALAYFLSYTGAIFDLCVGALLLWKPTRILGLILLVCFHGTNHFFLFDDIIWFPLLGVLTATIFLDPDWPEKLAARWHDRKKAPKKAAAPAPVTSVSPVRPALAGFIVLWISVQALVPLRHYFIAGDGRFTWEGLSFSWRLKAEIYRALPCEITLRDPELFSRDGEKWSIDWNKWKGERVVYRTVSPGAVDWARQPEIITLYEPELGDRIFYNLKAGGQSRTEAEARARVAALWQERYGRAPSAIHGTVSISEIVEAFELAVRAKGGQLGRSAEENLRLFIDTYGAAGNRRGMPTLRKLRPFALEKGIAGEGTFLVIEDAALFEPGQALPRLKSSAWKFSGERYTQIGGEALVLLVAAPTPESRRMFPVTCVMDRLEDAEQGPFVSWDYQRDTTPSKAMHIATNPFLLRRYAVRVAGLWQEQYGRRPSVYAKTAVSLNGRPPQMLVDPEADLASVGVSHFRHNAWIRDLELERIPKN